MDSIRAPRAPPCGSERSNHSPVTAPVMVYSNTAPEDAPSYATEATGLDCMICKIKNVCQVI